MICNHNSLIHDSPTSEHDNFNLHHRLDGSSTITVTQVPSMVAQHKLQLVTWQVVAGIFGASETARFLWGKQFSTQRNYLRIVDDTSFTLKILFIVHYIYVYIYIIITS